jgi:ketosteroid isomerase-like protein
MTHEQTLRIAYATFATGDVAGFLSFCTPDIRFVVPGRNQLANMYDSEAFASVLIPDVMRLSNGSFRETVLDVFTNDRGGIVHCEHELERDGRKHTYRTLHVYDIVDGKLASFREVPEDLHAFDSAWA